MKPGKKNSYNSLSDLKINNTSYKFYSLAKAEQNGLSGISKLPKSLKAVSYTHLTLPTKRIV